jgi:hypothetical protein
VTKDQARKGFQAVRQMVMDWSLFQRSNPLPMRINAESLALVWDIPIDEARASLTASERGALLSVRRFSVHPDYDAMVFSVLFNGYFTWSTGKPLEHKPKPARRGRK